MQNIKRSILIALLSNKDGLKSSELAEQLGVTTRTVRNHIKQINHFSSEPLILYAQNHFYLNNRQKIKKLIYKQDHTVHYPDYPADHSFLIFLLLYKNDYIKITDLEDQLHIMRNEIEQNLKSLRCLCQNWHLTILATKNGLSLRGSKIWKDFILSNLALKRINRKQNNQYLRLLFGTKDKQYYVNIENQLLHFIHNKYQIKLNDETIYVLTLMILLNDEDLESALSQQDFQNFIEEYVYYQGGLGLDLSSSNQKLLKALVQLYPYNQNFLDFAVRQLQLHSKLAEGDSKFFPLKKKKFHLNYLSFNYTIRDKELIDFLRTSYNIRKLKLVIYDSSSYMLGIYLDKLSNYLGKFPNIEIVATNNMFELDQLLHVKDKEVIYLAKNPRITVDDEKYAITYFSLKTNWIKKLINYIIDNCS